MGSRGAEIEEDSCLEYTLGVLLMFESIVLNYA